MGFAHVSWFGATRFRTGGEPHPSMSLPPVEERVNRSNRKSGRFFVVGILLFLGISVPAHADPSVGISAGDTAWVLSSAALVMFMTPGLGLFYAGMVP